LNPHPGYPGTDFKSVASTIPPPPHAYCSGLLAAVATPLGRAGSGKLNGPSHNKWLVVQHTTTSHHTSRGDGRIRTGGWGFADPCLATWPRHQTRWSGRRDSSSRPSPWQGDALPPSHFRPTQGAEEQNRTADTMIFSHVLYQLSYLGTPHDRFYTTELSLSNL
jgi:hypothetical protein